MAVINFEVTKLQLKLVPIVSCSDSCIYSSMNYDDSSGYLQTHITVKRLEYLFIEKYRVASATEALK